MKRRNHPATVLFGFGFPLVLLAASFLGPTAGQEPVARGGNELPVIQWNDNDRVSGELVDSALTLQLEVVRGAWQLLGKDQPGVETLAFREVGRAPENPGPMIRVLLGTGVRVSISNPLDHALVIHGLSNRQVAVMDSLLVPAGETREARFVADAAGTFYYWGTRPGVPMDERVYEHSQLNGALIVDIPESAPTPTERVMILSIWFADADEDGEPNWAAETFAINGRPWPHTERFEYDVGETVRWRLINTTDRTHPMHLHGFFFELEAKGDNARDHELWPADRRLGVTERMALGTTARLAFTPDRPGGWIFHCHISYHVVANALPGEYETGAERDEALLHGHHHGDMNRHVVTGMGGLMMGFYVRPPEGYVPDEPKRRELRLYIQSDSIPDERRRFGYALQEPGDPEPPRDRIEWPGPTIVSWQGEPTSVKVINRIAEASQVHWHGLEIESYFDGVAGVGGYPGNITPAIMPGDSFEMRITPPRPGSYMYHTHVNDIRQQSAGLYGGFVVLGEGEDWDPERDRVFLFSTNSDPDMSVLMNGAMEHGPLELTAGEMYRLRFMNITLFNGRLRVRLLHDDGFPATWRAIGKDGADLPAHQQVSGLAEQIVSVGETYDYAFTPREGATYRLEARNHNGVLFVEQPLLVRIVEQGR